MVQICAKRLNKDFKQKQEGEESYCILEELWIALRLYGASQQVK